jgi:hypothetical protein
MTLSAGRVVGRVERAGVLHQAGEDRGLVEVEVARVDVEVVLGGRLDAVGAVAEVDGVEVALEDPVLGVLLLQGDRVAQLLELAGVGVVDDLGALLLGARGGEEGLLDQLLGDRGPALDDAAGAEVGDQGAHGALDVEGAVLVEAVVLDRDDGLDHGARDLVERDVDPVLVEDRREHAAVAGQDGRLLGQRLGLELEGEVVGGLGGAARGEAEHARERDREPGHDDAEHDRDDRHHPHVGEDGRGSRTL